MKKRILGFVAMALFSGLALVQSAEVYVCISKTASKYHFDKNCRGLAKCTHKIEKVTVKKAKEMGFKELCGWED